MAFSRMFFGSIALFFYLSVAAIASAEPVSITKVEPTVFFPKVAEGQPLKQVVRLHLNNPGAGFEGQVKVSIQGEQPYTEDLGPVATGASVKEVRVSDRSQPAEVTFEIYKKDASGPVAVQKTSLQPQKKLTIYFVSYSHHDLGFGDYPHRIRTNIRHANIERPLEFCRRTDSWDFDDRYRFMIETSEPITSFLASHSPEVAEELAERIREGRIQIGALHNTANTGQLSHEGMARMFYLANRHCRDLLSIPPSKTAQIDDVIGLTWPLATFCKAAGVENLFHGYNPGIPSCMQPANKEPVFNWQGPDGQSRVVVRHESYALEAAGVVSEKRVNGLVSKVEKLGWAWDVLLMMDGEDYSLADFSRATAIRSWNTRYAYPHVIYSTQDMFFDALAAVKKQAPIRTFEGDANNEWSSMDSGDARLLAQARLAGEMIPTAEKFSTIASVLTPGGYPWTDIYQAYHRLLLHHEHTDGAASMLTSGAAGARYYETELEENREMGRDTLFFGQRALKSALGRLASAIATDTDRTLVVFNPLGRRRTDLVRLKADLPPGAFCLVDSASGETAPHQSFDGDVIFVASGVPAMGYKTFRVEPIDKGPTTSPDTSPADNSVLENRFYRIRFDTATGGIVSIHDKQLDVELVDGSAPQQFNEYLYENFRTGQAGGNVWYRPEKARFARSAGAVAQAMVVRVTAAGARNIQQQVILYEDLKRIDFVLSMDKSPSGMTLAEYARYGLKGKESTFIALPFAVPDFSIHHELPGAVIEPYRQQFTGSCTAYYPVRHFSDISNDKFGITVSALESSLVQYGYPRSYPMTNNVNAFDKNRDYPKHSRMYLYLMNNMWSMNNQIDQRGPQTFRWSMRSHAGNWQAGQADQFGWDIHNPLMTQWIEGKQKGSLPADGTSFVSVEPANVVCTTIKPAEHNGSGLILRFVETSGKSAEAQIALPLLDGIDAANETSLVENDKPVALAVTNDRTIRLSIPAFGVKTIRVLPRTPAKPGVIGPVTASAVSDMEIALSWPVNADVMKRISHFNVYRGKTPDFEPTLLNLVQRPARTSCVDRPKLHYGGWINNRLEPDTAYYYRVAAVDRWNNQGPISKAVTMKTLKSEQKNMTPLPVEKLSAIPVSPVAHYNSVNLIFRTNCESDIAQYHVYRGRQAEFVPEESNRIGIVKSDTILPGSHAYGRTPIDRRMDEFDHIMYDDHEVEPETTYYYRVCAVDTAGNRGPYSDEAIGRTGQDPPYVAKAQSVFSPQYGPQNAVDGNLHWSGAWVPARYGGGTKEQPKDVWLSIELDKPIAIKGIKLVGDERDICWPKNYQVFYRQDKQWRLGVAVRDAKQRTTLATWDQPIKTDGVKLLVSAADIPRYDDPQTDGALIICEVLLVLPDGTEKSPRELLP